MLLLLLRVYDWILYADKYGEGSILDLLASGLKSTLQNRQSVESVQGMQGMQGMQGLESGSRVNSAA
jgi:hypothetical protein